MNLNEQINFAIATVLLELRTSFNFSTFNNLKSLQEQFAYAKKHLKALGTGSSRAAFLLSNRYVLKMALPQAVEKGIAQNKGEVSVFTNPKTKPVVAAIYSFDPQYKWLIQEIARPIKSPEEFEQLTKADWETFDLLLQNYKNWQQEVKEQIEEYDNGIAQLQKRLEMSKDNPAALKRINQRIERLQRAKQKFSNTINSKVFQGALSLINDVGVMPGDLREWDHWAKTADGRVVLIDYGFTRDVVHLYR